MAKALHQILGGRNLTGVIQSVKPGLPAGIIPPEALRVTRTVEGDTATYTRVEGTRQTARAVMYGSPSVRRSQAGIAEVPVKLIHSFEHMLHKPATLMNLRNMDNEDKQKLGRQEISRQTRDFRQLFDNLRLAAAFMALGTGHIYFDGDGNLLPTSSGATVTIDYGIPAANKNQLGGIIGTTWATDSTDILGDLTALIKYSVQTTGYMPYYAFYGSNIAEYIFSNTAFKNAINGNSSYAAQTAQGQIPDGLGGIAKWVPAYNAFFADADGTVQSIWGADTIVFTPAFSPDWWEFIEGTYPVPTTISNISADAAAALGQIAVVSGMFSYAKVLDDPVTIKHCAGDTFLPVIKVPGAVFIADVTP